MKSLPKSRGRKSDRGPSAVSSKAPGERSKAKTAAPLRVKALALKRSEDLPAQGSKTSKTKASTKPLLTNQTPSPSEPANTVAVTTGTDASQSRVIDNPLLNPIYLKMQGDPYFRSGYVFQAAGNLPAAVACYTKSIQATPSPEAHTFLALALHMIGEKDGAIFHTKRAVELHPQFGQAWNDLGTYLLERHDYDQAVECFEKALECPSYDQASITHHNLGRAYMSKGLLVKAQKEFEAALKLDQKLKPAEFMLRQLQRSLH